MLVFLCLFGAFLLSLTQPCCCRVLRSILRFLVASKRRARLYLTLPTTSQHALSTLKRWLFDVPAFSLFLRRFITRDPQVFSVTHRVRRRHEVIKASDLRLWRWLSDDVLAIVTKTVSAQDCRPCAGGVSTTAVASFFLCRRRTQQLARDS